MKTGLSPRRQLKLKRKVDKFLLGLTKDVDELLFARNCAVRHVEDVLLAASPQADREDTDPEEEVRSASSKRFKVVAVNPVGSPQIKPGVIDAMGHEQLACVAWIKTSLAALDARERTDCDSQIVGQLLTGKPICLAHLADAPTNCLIAVVQARRRRPLGSDHSRVASRHWGFPSTDKNLLPLT